MKKDRKFDVSIKKGQPPGMGIKHKSRDKTPKQYEIIDRGESSPKLFKRYYHPRSGLLFKLDSVNIEEDSDWVELNYINKRYDRTFKLHIKKQEAIQHGLIES